MYKALIRAGIRTAIRRLNKGDAGLLLSFAADDVELAFPGHNSWATMFRPQRKDRSFHPTHVGRREAEAFARRFVDAGIQVDIEDILVNGPPWKTRVAIRASDHIPPTQPDLGYNNRYVDFLELRWGRIRRFEVYEDTERTAEWDRSNSLTSKTCTDTSTVHSGPVPPNATTQPAASSGAADGGQQPGDGLPGCRPHRANEPAVAPRRKWRPVPPPPPHPPPGP